MSKAILVKSGKFWTLTIIRGGGSTETIRFPNKDAALRYCENAGLKIGKL